MNPVAWSPVDRFQEEMSDAYINDRICRIPEALTDLHSKSDTEATEDLRRAFEFLVIPTSQMRFVLRNMTSKARAYARYAYGDAPSFLSRIYSSEKVADSIRLTLLTGLAGCGKTVILNAFLRLHSNAFVELPDHASFNLRPAWMLTAESGVGAKSLLLPHFRQSSDRGRLNLNSTEVIRECSTQGVSILLGDEFQFISRNNGSALAANTILKLSKIGPPVFIATNYSLLHSFMRRPQEDRQRFFSDVLELYPEPRESEDWIAIVRGALQVASEFTRLLEAPDIHLQLHELTFGNGRLLTNLLRHSFSAMRERSASSVTISDVHKAYASINFSAARDEIRRLEAGVLNRDSLPPDLYSPVSARPCYAGPSDNACKNGQEVLSEAQAELAKSLNADESSAMEIASNKKSPTKPRAAKPKFSADSLIDATNRFNKGRQS